MIPRKSRITNTPRSTTQWGGRIREINVSKTFPGEKVAIKRMHNPAMTAKKEIEQVIEVAKWHNTIFKNKKYDLIEPTAHHIGNGLAAMTKLNAPSAKEILEKRTERGKRFLGMLKKKGVNEEEFSKAINKIYKNLSKKYPNQDNPAATFSIILSKTPYIVKLQNILALGYKNGKFQFTLAMDSF